MVPQNVGDADADRADEKRGEGVVAFAAQPNPLTVSSVIQDEES
jgi:hypothetical protein